MKKFFIVMMIAFMSIGMVFADAESEAHTLYVTVTITAVEPIFQLRYGSQDPSNGSTTFGNGTVYAAGPYSIGSDASRIDVKADIEESDKAIEVTAVVNNAAKISQTYSLKFSDGVFSGVKIGNDTFDIIPKITTEPASATTGIDAGSGTAGEVSVHFNGIAMDNTSSSSAYTLATATYYYTGDPTINMGTYYADILLTITNES